MAVLLTLYLFYNIGQDVSIMIHSSAVNNSDSSKLECFSLTVTSTLVLYLQATPEPTQVELFYDSSLRVGSKLCQ